MDAIVVRSFATVIAAACLVAIATPLAAIETTYGEDPVPDTHYYKGFIQLGYGIDPIPAKTLSQRWHAWRASRGLPSQMGFFHRDDAPPPPPLPSEPPAAGKSGDARPSARRVRDPGRPQRTR